MRLMHTAFHSAIIVDRNAALRLGKRWMTKLIKSTKIDSERREADAGTDTGSVRRPDAGEPWL